MHYQQSEQILQLLNSSQRTFVNCHINADIDSIGSALAISNYMQSLGKKAEVYSPNQLTPPLSFLKGYESIKVGAIDNDLLSEYDLLVFLDTPDEKRIGCELNESNKDKSIVIDHHQGNTEYGKLNRIDSSAGSTGEILYRLFSDFNADIEVETGSAILAAMAGDSSGFRNQGANSNVFKYVSELMETGVDKTKILTQIYGSMSIEAISFFGEFLQNFQISTDHPYCWNVITKEMLNNYGDTTSIELYSGLFLRALKDTEFGMLFIEKDSREVEFHIKARADIDVSPIATNLGGGGHRRAGGSTLKDRQLNEVVTMALKEADDFYRKR